MILVSPYTLRYATLASIRASRSVWKRHNHDGKNVNPGIGDSKWKPSRILFCGSDEFSVASLRAVLDAKNLWESVDVLTPRVREVGRGGKGKKGEYVPALQHFANARGLTSTQVPPSGISQYELPETFRQLPPSPHNLLLTASFGHILPNSFLRHFHPSQRLNVHPSLLPKYRGAAPLQWTIANGDRETGVTVQRLVEKGKGIDGGEVVGVRDGITVRDDVRFGELMSELAVVGGELLVDVLRQMKDGTVEPRAQDTSKITRAPKITGATARIYWLAQDAISIDRMDRAFSQQYPLWATFSGTPVQLFDLAIHIPSSPAAATETIPPGTASLDRRSKPPRLVIACADQSFISVGRLKSQAKKEVQAADWWNGLPQEHRGKRAILLE